MSYDLFLHARARSFIPAQPLTQRLRLPSRPGFRLRGNDRELTLFAFCKRPFGQLATCSIRSNFQLQKLRCPANSSTCFE
jgi:hypothetical protein